MTFQEKLGKIMNDGGYKQLDVANKTGYSQASISLWLSGKKRPPVETQVRIAIAFGLDAFALLDDEPDDSRQLKVERISVEEASKITGMSQETIKKGMRDGIIKWGYAIEGTGGRWVYYINKRKFCQTEMLEMED